MKAFALAASAILLASSAAHGQLRAEILKRFPTVGRGGEAVKVSFCPHDPSKALAHQGDHQCVINIDKGEISHLHLAGEVMDWFGDQLLMRASDSYQLIQKGALKASKASAASAQAALAHAERPILVGRGKKARIVRASDKKTLFKAPFRKGIYGIETTADATQWIIYLGGSEYLLYDAVTKKKTKLPQTVPGSSYGFSAWKASPDGSAIGEIGLPPAGVSPDSEEAEAVGHTLLYRYDLKTKALSSIQLPVELANKALNVLDSGVRGHLFLTASEQGERVRQQAGRARPPPWCLRDQAGQPVVAAFLP